MVNLFPIRVLFYQLYLLQLEEYDFTRYFKLILKTKGLPQNPTRKTIDWTQKLKLLFVVALAFHLLVSFGLGFLFHQFVLPQINYLLFVFFLLFFLILSYFFFAFLLLSLFLVSPIDSYLKKRIIHQATLKMKAFPNLKVIGIAGSYGKTTMKELIAAVISQKYKTVKTPKNLNTPLGIARTILKEITAETEYFVVEMGEYAKGDVKHLCDLAKPDISVVTGINEAHLERMGNIQNTIETIFEVVENMKPGGTVLLNGDDKLVKENYEKFCQGHDTIVFTSANKIKDLEIHTIHFEQDASGISFDVKQRGLDLGRLKIAALGEYIIPEILGVIKLSEKLGLSVKEISDGIASMKPVEHRLQPIYNHNTKILVIDDSYNGNPQGVKEAIAVLSKFDQHRRIYLTPGLVEAGERTRDIHYNIGKQLAKVAGLVILIKNTVTPFIAEGLEKNGFKKEDIIWFNSAKEAHANLGKLLRPYDVILFQNDWPDNYI